jgi:hypothetical protein
MDGGEKGRNVTGRLVAFGSTWNRLGLRALRLVERTTRALTALGAALIAGPRGWWFAEPLTPALKHSFASAASIGSIAAPRRVPRRAGSPARQSLPSPTGCAFAHIPTGTTANHRIDVDEAQGRSNVMTVAPVRYRDRPGYTLEDGSGCLTIGVHLTAATG